MSFFKIIIFLSLMLIPTISFSDSHDQKKEVLEQVKEIAKEMEDDEDDILGKAEDVQHVSRLGCQALVGTVARSA